MLAFVCIFLCCPFIFRWCFLSEFLFYFLTENYAAFCSCFSIIFLIFQKILLYFTAVKLKSFLFFISPQNPLFSNPFQIKKKSRVPCVDTRQSLFVCVVFVGGFRCILCVLNRFLLRCTFGVVFFLSAEQTVAVTVAVASAAIALASAVAVAGAITVTRAVAIA